MWLLLALSGPLLWAISTHIDKYLVERYFKNSDTAVLMVFTALIGLLSLPIITSFQPSVFATSKSDAAVLMTSGILYMGAMLLYLRVIQTEEASVVAPFFQASTLFTFLLAYLFLGETLNGRELLGAGLIVAGAVSASVDKSFRLRKEKFRFIGQMLAATFVLALSSVIFKFFAVRDQFWNTTFWTFAGQSLFGFVILAIPRYRQQFTHLFRRHPGPFLAVNGANELVNLGGGIGVRYASLLAPVALVSAVSSTTTLFVFGIGIFLTVFFPKLGREDLSKRALLKKGASAILVATGVILLGGQKE